MMMKIVFDDAAVRDLEDIYGWFAGESPKAAQSMEDRLRAAIRQLSTFPLSGRPGVGGTRELIVPRLPYVVIYEVDAERNRLIVTAVIHMARDRER